MPSVIWRKTVQIYDISMTFWQIGSNGFAVIHSSFLNNIGQSCRLCLQFVWQLSRRQMSVGVLGSPERNFVDIGQARTKIALANA